ncbi:hypothetical protein HMPREF0645_2369 [Hallella bergensis DSM 17361]|uniref:Uncharacterized protein n=1 Tax=Hallella bergensis DSM 17361 TaxID=585502 RepID=D1PZI4_9BACT|nr:hypothetical protein [Hallella bergensis]EFA43142.1 hypothetical protein HMPREF0645_2369 [Hallella bergensis DSM 17361]
MKDKFHSEVALQNPLRADLQNEAVYRTRALLGKAQESAGLLLQRIIRITECGKGDDEGKWATVFHGFFQGAHGEHIHCKINFRQVSEHTEPKVY